MARCRSRFFAEQWVSVEKRRDFRQELAQHEVAKSIAVTQRHDKGIFTEGSGASSLMGGTPGAPLIVPVKDGTG